MSRKREPETLDGADVLDDDDVCDDDDYEDILRARGRKNTGADRDRTGMPEVSGLQRGPQGLHLESQ